MKTENEEDCRHTEQWDNDGQTICKRCGEELEKRFLWRQFLDGFVQASFWMTRDEMEKK